MKNPIYASFTNFDIEQSFSSDGIGFRSRKLVNRDGIFLANSENAWLIGMTAYSANEIPSEIKETCDSGLNSSAVHDVTLSVALGYIEELITITGIIAELLQKKSSTEGIEDIRGNILDYDQVRDLVGVEKVLFAESLIIRRGMLDEAYLPKFIRTYSLFWSINSYIEMRMTDEILARNHLENADFLRMSINRLAAFEKHAKKSAKNAAKARHKENAAIKADFLAWYEANHTTFSSYQSAAKAGTKIVNMTQRTLADWISKYEKSRTQE
ncbi:MAG TPA: hypothetical protein DCR51_06430 [Idiomarina loihiensis]|uniref:hypothetical protein n=1 Tax=Gilvimarinus agarilyticus TaxID=679259 RepID=UPI0005A1E0EF|nr:hypothetical protein [Gilvimarinus agarilyticus]HAS22768.1 hypothetical protein [Idiomarina loihiensis]